MIIFLFEWVDERDALQDDVFTRTREAHLQHERAKAEELDVRGRAGRVALSPWRQACSKSKPSSSSDIGRPLALLLLARDGSCRHCSDNCGSVEALTDRSSSPTPEELRIGEAAGSIPTTDLARCF